jgi:hypothetical protein
MKNRARLLVNIEVQLRVVLTALAVASLVLSANFFLWLASISNAVAENRSNINVVLAYDALRTTMTRQFILCIGLAIPMAAALGIFYSFKFAGPIYRFTRYFTDLASGRWDKPCNIRKGDDLQELCGRINGGLEPMRTALRNGQAILTELTALATAGVVQGAGPDRERFESLLRRAEAARDELAVRLPPSAPAAATAQREPEHEVASA